MNVAASGRDPYLVINLSKTNRDGTSNDKSYQARFGDLWRREIVKCILVTPPPHPHTLVYIIELIKSMVAESIRVVTSTKHTYDWHFYLTTLSLMTAK